MTFQLSRRTKCLVLLALSLTIPRSVDSSDDDASGERDECLELSASGCANENVSDYEACADPSICGAGATQGNLPLAFGLTIGAGLSTTLGALMPCIPVVKRSNKFFLSAALAMAGGVMLYVSFTEIFTKAHDYLCCATSQHAYLLATISLFLGVAFTVLLDMLLKLLKRMQCTAVKRRLAGVRSRFRASQDGTPLQVGNPKLHSTNPLESVVAMGNSWESGVAEKCNERVAAENGTESVQVCTSNEVISSNSLPSDRNDIGPTNSNVILINSSGNEESSEVAIQISPKRSIEQEREDNSNMVTELGDTERRESSGDMEEVVAKLSGNSTRLQQMGLLTALALSLHNFPEGLATFIAALSDPSLGVTLAIAIALHNIPEGMCVSMPVYYATGSRIKAFIWAFLSGVSEPIGALLGWLILNDLLDSHGAVVYGVAFGLISGLMIYLSLKELIPMSYQFDSTGGTIVTVFLLIGMIIMALSLVLFEYT